MSDIKNFIDDKTNQENEKAELKAFCSELKSKYNINYLHVFLLKGGFIDLGMIAFKKEDQGNGYGTKAMNELIEYADRKKLTIILDAAEKDILHGTTSRNRLVKFYKRFGFVENKGRNKDYELSSEMYRQPNQKLEVKNKRKI